MSFRPEPPTQQTPGLAARIQSLTGEGRYRTALDELLLGMLDRNPKDPEALWLALIVLAASYSRTSALKAAEPLGRRHLWDPRLDALFAVCSRCQKSWVPAGALYAGYAKRSFVAYTGLQCRACDYVICSNCVSQTHVGLDVSYADPTCPSCGRAALEQTVYPTGRPPMQLARRREPIRKVLVFREGPVAPDPEYLMQVLEERCPDAIEQRAQLTAFPMHPWPRDIKGVAEAVLARDDDFGGAQAHGLFQDDSGARVFLMKVFEKAASGPANFILKLLSDHVLRLPPDFSPTVRSKLLQPARMTHTAQVLEKLHDRAFAERRNVAEAYPDSDLLLILSAVPARELAEVRSYFPGGYIKFLMEQVMSRTSGDAVHWVLCADDQGMTAHLSCMPEDRSALLLLATDLMTQAEKAAGGLV